MRKVFLLLLAMLLVFSFTMMTGCEKAKEKTGEVKEKAAGYDEPKGPGYGEPKGPGYGEPKAPGYDKPAEEKH